jgi:polar amino acid transport system substrate-binding protein
MHLRRRHLAGLALSASSWVHACPNLKLAVLLFPGMNQRASDGRVTGFDADIAAEISRRSGCSLTLEESNASRMWPLLSRGELPLSASVAWLPERREVVDYLLLFRLRGFVLMSREQAMRTPTRAAFDQDPSLRIGIVRKARRPASVQAWVDALASQGRVSEAVDSHALLRVYEAGRVQAILSFAGGLRSQPAAWQAQQQLLTWWDDYWTTFGWAASREALAPEWRARLREAAEAARKDGALKRIAHTYWGGPGEPMYEVLPAVPG